MWDKLAKALITAILENPELLAKIIEAIIDAFDGDDEV